MEDAVNNCSGVGFGDGAPGLHGNGVVRFGGVTLFAIVSYLFWFLCVENEITGLPSWW